MTTKTATAALAAALLAGCATQAQIQYRNTVDGVQSAVTDLKACTATVLAKPDYAPLAGRPYPSDKGATTAQLIDQTMPSSQEAPLLGARDDELATCRSTAQARVIPLIPALVAPLEQFQGALQTTTVMAVERKITWGEYARRDTEIWSAWKVLAASVGQQFDAQMNAAHQAEMQDRQTRLLAASKILLDYSLQQQVINAANRPIVTSCMGTGTMASCVTR
jgi:hypothetical protein